MRFPIQLNASLTRYIVRQKLAGVKKYPLVLMLEPLHSCNLACMGCGRIREYRDTIKDTLTLSQCMNAVKECGAPVISICGGEPLIYPEIGPLVGEILGLGRHIHLCTNALKLSESLDKFTPAPYFNFVVSIDGLEKTQELTRGRKGIFDVQIKAIKDAKARGFRVITNTTLYKETQIEEVQELFDMLTAIGVDGLLVTPGFSYTDVKEDIFLDKEESFKKFKYLLTLSKRYRYFNTPLYMRFLAGERELKCTPWGNVTYNPQGWKAPCYVITDKHYKTYRELMDKTDWDRYVNRKDPRCRDCMIHSGAEATAVEEVGKSARDIIEMVKWNLS